ncbi:facilitated trehalose transporter Tret1 [Manduca sexta]|uniref:facilitated trehalose transporter Tret1 n=1 Tax=Manduca sexta TaxID=7130 RepID=UPI00188F1959|nr:facilitated trehalose transporter Tret1 [Manduca sexta]XP_037300957.1 facilitated trehalose transporter Tret1 [Manduca sexta]
MNIPFLRQILVASSPQLAAISVGGAIGFPSVLLEQLKTNDSSIQLEMELSTWIGSSHGFAGIPSILMPTLMQWKGRKMSYFISCLFIFIGWLLIYFSENVITIIIGECFQGLGNNSLVVATFNSLSEMLDPKFRIIAMSIYINNEALGVSVASIIGRYLHWNTVSIAMSIPITLALIIGFLWPESPSWLAYKGDYVKCEEAFLWLRGSSEDSQKELKELLRAQKEMYIANRKSKVTLKKLGTQITSRDFYMPLFQSFVILCSVYGSGILVVIVYGIDMMQKATKNSSATHFGMIIIFVSIYLGSLVSIFLMKFFKNITVYMTSGVFAATFMLGASVVTFLQSVSVVSEESLLCLFFIIFFVASTSMGISTTGYCLAAEVMPVKHRGLGGATYIIQVCILHSVILKFSPYLILYMNLWATFMLFSVIEYVCMIYVWKNVPETKGRTLQEIEDFYNHGRFVTRSGEIEEECLARE